MAVMKDITSYSNIMDDSRSSSPSDDNIFVSFSTPRPQRDQQARSLMQTSRISHPPFISLSEEFPNDRVLATSLNQFQQTLDDMPSCLLTPTSPNDVEIQKFLPDCYSRPRKRLCVAERDIGESALQQKLQRLSKTKLVEIINTLVSERHPELHEEIFQLLPEPQLKEMECKLKKLKKNVFKSFPYRGCHVGSTRDVFNYRRVYPHIVEFKRECIDQGKELLENSLWKITIEYVLMAWDYINALPTWDSPSHNSCKTSCFRTLAVQFHQALIQGAFTIKEYQKLKTRLQEACILNNHLQPCLNKINELLSHM